MMCFFVNNLLLIDNIIHYDIYNSTINLSKCQYVDFKYINYKSFYVVERFIFFVYV